MEIRMKNLSTGKVVTSDGIDFNAISELFREERRPDIKGYVIIDTTDGDEMGLFRTKEEAEKEKERILKSDKFVQIFHHKLVVEEVY